MLTDFIRDVVSDIDKATQNEISNLIAAEGSSRHDLIRGRIDGLSSAKTRILAVVKRYNMNDGDTPAQVQSPRVEALRRHIGGR